MACWMWRGVSGNGLEACGASILTQRVSQRRHGAKTSKRREPDTACSGAVHSTVSAETCDVTPSARTIHTLQAQSPDFG
jgi:hypothetical protein